MAEVPLLQVDPGVSLKRAPDPPGTLTTYLTVLDGEIILDFGVALRWVRFTAAQAEKLATEITDAVRAARTLHVPGGSP